MASGSGSSRRFAAAAAADSLAPVQCQQVLLAWSVASSSGVECSVMDCGQDLPAGFKAPLLIVGEQPAHTSCDGMGVEATACVTQTECMQAACECVGMAVWFLFTSACVGMDVYEQADTHSCLQLQCLCGGLQHALCFTVPAECRQCRQSDQLKDCWQSVNF